MHYNFIIYLQEQNLKLPSKRLTILYEIHFKNIYGRNVAEKYICKFLQQQNGIYMINAFHT